MPPKKTIDAYIEEIKELHGALKEYPDNETIQSKLNSRVGSLAKLHGITIFAAQNEQIPWAEEDLGYPVRPMLLKEKSGLQQVGDYQAYYHYESIIGLNVEPYNDEAQLKERLYKAQAEVQAAEHSLKALGVEV